MMNDKRREAAVTALVNAAFHSAHMASERIDHDAAQQVFNGCMAALNEIGVRNREIRTAITYIEAETTWINSGGGPALVVIGGED